MNEWGDFHFLRVCMIIRWNVNLKIWKDDYVSNLFVMVYTWLIFNHSDHSDMLPLHMRNNEFLMDWTIIKIFFQWHPVHIASCNIFVDANFQPDWPCHICKTRCWYNGTSLLVQIVVIVQMIQKIVVYSEVQMRGDQQ